jgi:hypothetical protein
MKNTILIISLVLCALAGNGSICNDIERYSNTEEISKIDSEYKNIKGVIGIVVRSSECKFGDTIIIYNDKNQITQFIILKDEYEIMALDCLDVTDEFYKVRFENGEVGYLDVASGKVLLNTFEEHILNLFSIEFESKNPPRKLATEKSEPLNFDKDSVFHPVKIEGDWLQVEWELNGNTNFGWVRWKKDDTILIEFFYFA